MHWRASFMLTEHMLSQQEITGCNLLNAGFLEGLLIVVGLLGVILLVARSLGIGMLLVCSCWLTGCSFGN